MNSLFSTKTLRKHTAADGSRAAHRVTPVSGDFEKVTREFSQLNSREAQAVFADRWLAVASSQFNHTWPMIYQMLQLVEAEQLYKEPRKLSGVAGPGSPPEFPKGFDSFQEYFEARVKQPFATWAELEHTHRYVHKYAPDLIEKAWPEARDAALGKHGGDRKSEAVKDQVGNARLKGNGSVERILARLDRDGHAELAAMVRTGKMSANAAAQLLDWRKKPKLVCPSCGHEFTK